MGVFLGLMALFLIGAQFHPFFKGHSRSLSLLAVGVACAVNFGKLRLRVLHCAIAGPVFLGLSALSFLQDFGRLDPAWTILWPAALAATGAGFLAEWALKRQNVEGQTTKSFPAVRSHVHPPESFS